jgi:hypothetical protein
MVDSIERAYRRGAHQTANAIAEALEELTSIKQARAFVDELTDELQRLRNSNQPIGCMLAVALGNITVKSVRS